MVRSRGYLGSVGSPQYTRGSRKHLANGRCRKPVASIQMADRTHRWHEAKKVYISLISYLFPCPAGQVLFQKICAPREKVRVAIPWLFGIRDVSCGWFHGGKTMLTEKRNVHDFRSTCATNKANRSKAKETKTRNILSIKKTVPGQRRDLIKVNVVVGHGGLVRHKSNCHCIPDGICEQALDGRSGRSTWNKLTVKIEVM
ncbi:hypothetical protein J3E68DRAFT_142629 [Trichoderma sp. SZMC 28012]